MRNRTILQHRSRARHAEQGFTLVEMSVVVAIVGILSVLAVVGYRRLITSSHLSEATGMVNSMRVAEESVHAETGNYVSTATALGWIGSMSTLCPNASPGAFKTGWDIGTARNDCSGWAKLPVHVDGPVMYGYSAISDRTTTPTFPANTLSGSAATGEWYTITAVGDPDGDKIYSGVVGSSLTNDLFIQGNGN